MWQTSGISVAEAAFLLLLSCQGWHGFPANLQLVPARLPLLLLAKLCSTRLVGSRDSEEANSARLLFSEDQQATQVSLQVGIAYTR